MSLPAGGGEVKRVGRGRGRGRGASGTASNVGAAVVEQTPDPATVLAKNVSSLALHPGAKAIKDFITAATEDGWSDNKSSVLAFSLSERCKRDWKFAETAALICSGIISLDSLEGAKTVRHHFLKEIQSTFVNKDRLRDSSPPEFLACIALLCQFFCHIKVAGEPMKPLVKPVLESLNMLLDNKTRAQEMTCAAKQLLSVGKFLHQLDSASLTEIIRKTRDCILDERGDRESRLMLLDVLEASASDWTWHVE